MDLLEPFVPTSADPWDFDKAAHLARRAGFAETPERVQRLMELGPERAVEEFLPLSAEDSELERRIRETGGALTELNDDNGIGAEVVEHVRAWWLYRMVYSGSPLLEKLVLLWHDHFAVRESDDLGWALLLHQNQTLRRLAAASFRELLHAVARDPAMLVFLDGRNNDKRNPNENWARELLELFTLGLDQYTQADIVDIARVFTGWSTESKDSLVFVFVPENHDTGDKLVFGRTIRGRSGRDGQEEGNEVLELILARSECAEFLAAKLLHWFVHPAPPPEVVRGLAESLQGSGYSIRAALRQLFRSRYFCADETRWTLFKNPVEYAVSALRSLQVQNAHLLDVHHHERLMGMDLFKPPSVAGWNHGRSWIQTGYVIERFHFALRLSEIPHSAHEVAGSPAFDLGRIAGEDCRSSEALVAALEQRLLQRTLSPEGRRAAIAALDAEDADRRGVEPSELCRRKTRAAIHLLMTAPEFAFS